MSVSQGQWLAHFDRHSKSNLSIKAYCRKFRLRECQWFYWRRKLTGNQQSQGEGNSFVPVEISRHGSADLSITLKSGIVIQLPAHTDPEAISRTIQVLLGSGL